jgi:ribosomal protein L4
VSEAADNNVEVQEEELFVEEIDLEAIGKQFESQTLMQRVKMLVRGLKAPAGSREYKEALIHQVVVAQLANKRQGTPAALTRSEVR